MRGKFGLLNGFLFSVTFLLLNAFIAFGQQSTATQPSSFVVGTPQSRFEGQTTASDSLPNGVEAAAIEPLTVVTNTTLAIGFDDSLTDTGAFFIPADPSGAAGPTQLVATVNAMIESRSKTGTQLWRTSLKTFFAPLGASTLGTFTFDAKVVYDEYAGRFVVAALERSEAPNASRLLLAVSQTASPATSSATDWYYAAIDSLSVSDGENYWAEYAALAVDEEAVYVTADTFSFTTATYGGSRLWIINKGVAGGFYAGGAATVAAYDPYATCGDTGCVTTTTMPTQIHGAGGAGATIGTYLVSYSGFSSDNVEYVQVIRVDNPLTTPTFVHQLIEVGDIEDVLTPMIDAPQSGTAFELETNDRRALDAVWRNNQLWLVATILPNAGVDSGQVTAHWWHLNTSGSQIVLSDQGNIGGEDIVTGAYTFFPSVAVNGVGSVCFGFSASSPTTFAGAYAAARTNSDPAGTVQSSGTVHAGLDYYVRTFGGVSNRWGDHSSVSVDPANNTTFWVYNQFADTRGSVIFGEDGRWRTTWGNCTSDYALGDVNGDGSVNVSDLQLLINIILQVPEAAQYPTDWRQRADLNASNSWDATDLQLLINLILSIS